LLTVELTVAEACGQNGEKIKNADNAKASNFFMGFSPV
jgi:hypothetical protein